jgi:glycosyltransferase involved in cell wall biosynthesis
MNQDLPNLLVLSDEGPQTGTAGGLLMHRLLAKYPPERLRVLSRHLPTIGDPLPDVVYRRLMIPLQRLETTRFSFIKRSMSAWGLTPPASVRRIDRLLGTFVPDVVFCVMQNAEYFGSAQRYARRHGISFIVAVHDVNEVFEPVYACARRARRKRNGRFYRAAARRLCISPEMEWWCAARYGARGDVLYPNRSDDLRPRSFELSRQLRRPGTLSIGFAGNLNYGYGLGLCQALPSIRRAGIRLVLYSHTPYGIAAPLNDATDCCEFRGFVPADEAWAGIKRDCDAVWLPYPNPAGTLEPLYRRHFPSKLTEYLALGMPVLVTGPDYATGVQWARANSHAIVSATGTEESEMAAVFDRLANDANWRFRLASESWQVGLRDFDPVQIREQFYAHLRSAAES